MIFSSSLLENAVNEFAKLPGIGKKTALRLVLTSLKKDVDEVTVFSEAILKLRRKLIFVPGAIILLISLYVISAQTEAASSI